LVLSSYRLCQSKLDMSHNHLPIIFRSTWHQISVTARTRTPVRLPSNSRGYSQPASAGKTAHAQWYSDLLPGMIPVALLGSAVYLGLQLIRENLAHEKYLVETRARVKELETEVADLRGAKEDALTSSNKSTTWFWRK